MRSNPGGFNGSDGRDGYPSRYRASDGIQGAQGRFRIIVVDAAGNITSTTRRLILELISFDVTSEYAVLEPDSLISIDNVVVRNCGGMPLPDNYTIRVFLEVDRWLLYDQVDLEMQCRCAPGIRSRFRKQGCGQDWAITWSTTRGFSRFIFATTSIHWLGWRVAFRDRFEVLKKGTRSRFDFRSS